MVVLVDDDRQKAAYADLSLPTVAARKWKFIVGRDGIAAYKDELIELAQRCGQAGTLEYLPYYLAFADCEKQAPHPLFDRLPPLARLSANWKSKIPRLLLRTGPAGIEVAVLMMEHRLFGLSTRLFIPFDPDGYRSIIAPARERPAVAKQAAEMLLAKGAGIVLMSYMDTPETYSARLQNAGHTPEILFREAPQLIGIRVREFPRTLPLHATFDETIAGMGADTRRSLRRHHRRAVAELGAEFVPRVVMSLAEFQKVSAACTHKVSEATAALRHCVTQDLHGGVFAGMRDGKGRWLSLIGAHRHADVLYINWQMNIGQSGTLSLVSAMRWFLISDEIAQGTRLMRFEAGTPHVMNSAFTKEFAHDLLFAARSISPRLLKWIFAKKIAGGPLATTVTSDSTIWRS